MNKKERKEIVDLLKSGNFTVASHNFGQVSLYKGKFKGYNLYREVEGEGEMPDFPKGIKEVYVCGVNDGNGYEQPIISLFVEALGGSNGGSA